MTGETQFITLSEVARKLNLSWPRACALHEAGVLNEDAQVSNSYLFKASRITELQRKVQDFGIAKATKANAKKFSK
jgi:hypothetical protein